MSEEPKRILQAKPEIQMVDPRILTPHPRNAHLRGKKMDAAVRESIKHNGIRTPLECNEFGLVYKGAGTRLPMALELGFQTVPVVVTELMDPDEIEKALLIDNIHADDNNYQRARLYQTLKRIEEKPARDRQRQASEMTHAKLGRKSSGEMLPSNVTEASPKGDVRDIAAKMAGLKPTTAERSLKILAAIDLAHKHNLPDLAQMINDGMNKSFLCGYSLVVDLGMHLAQTQPLQLMRVQGHELLSRWRWEAVTGCGEGCKDCPICAYAEVVPADFLETTQVFIPQLARRLHIFSPCEHRNRMQAPLESTPPEGDGAPSSAYRILTCWLGDLFGPGVESAWLDEVLTVIRSCASANFPWRFLLRTCHPDALLQVHWPANVELGIYLCRWQQLAIVENALMKLRRQFPGHQTFLFVPPREELLHFTSLANCSWLYLGDYPAANAVGHWQDQPTLPQLTALNNLATRDKCHLIIPPRLRFTIPDE